MNPAQRLYWQIRNEAEAALTQYRNRYIQAPVGCLTQRKKDEDFGVFGLFERKPQYKSYTRSVPKWVYSQNPLNICTFVTAAIGYSLQEGRRFSVKFLVKCGAKERIISGNGFCYQRGPLDMAHKYGMLPYSSMPDEVTTAWPDFSKWDVTQAQLVEAAQYKPPSYRVIRNVSEAIDAVENGYVLLTANKWYSAMNRPQSPDYYLVQAGAYVGGHAWPSPGYRALDGVIKDWASHQSFGARYGLGGLARIKSLFNRGQYDVYIQEKDPNRTDIERATGLFEGLAIKGKEERTVYWIENGTKRAFTSEKAYNGYATYSYTLDQNLINSIPNGEPIYA